MGLHEQIYEGIWTNQARGPVAGTTLTLTSRDGAYLVAFLAIFVHVTGTSVWRLVSYTIFMFRARTGLADCTKQQQQAVLRNSASAITAFRGFVHVIVRSKNTSKNLSLIIWAALNAVGFLAAGIFSSKIVNTRSDVLLEPTGCGRWWAYAFDGDRGGSNYPRAANRYYKQLGALRDVHTTASHYASACYGNNGRPNDCTAYGRREPSWTSSFHSGCVFEESMCLENKTFIIDSGHIFSDLDLGINSAPRDRLSLRIVKECAPLKREGYMYLYDRRNISSIFKDRDTYGTGYAMQHMLFNTWPPNENTAFEAFFYGEQMVRPSKATFIFNNDTFAWSAGASSSRQHFQLDVEKYMSSSDLRCPSPWGCFDAIPELKVPQQDLTLIFLSSDVVYNRPVNDPWFRADKPLSFPNPWLQLDPNGPAKLTNYLSKYATSALGCSERTELCKVDGLSQTKCLALGGTGFPYEGNNVNWADASKSLGLNQRQTAIANRLQDAIFQSSFSDIVADMGAQNLLASQSIASTFSDPLPDTQWTVEIEHWFAAMLSAIQLYNTQFVTGWQGTAYDKFVTPPPREDEWMCHNQIIERKDYASFSVLGLCVILIIGMMIICINACLHPIIRRIRPYMSIHEHRLVSWDANELLELQRVACQVILARSPSVISAVPTTEIQTKHEVEKKDLEMG